jgi:hypothetical protein
MTITDTLRGLAAAGRLTQRKEYNCPCWNDDNALPIYKRYLKLLDRLAAYEDIAADGGQLAQWGIGASSLIRC